MPRTIAKLMLALTLVAAFAAAPAQAGYRDLLIDACREDERVDGSYSQKDYREALDNLTDDHIQYTDCEAILRAAQLAAARKQSGGGLSSGSPIDNLIAGAGGDPLAGATPQERAAVEQEVVQADKTGGRTLRVGGELVKPSSLGAGRVVAATASDLPTPLLLALALAAITSLATLAAALIPRIRSLRRP